MELTSAPQQAASGWLNYGSPALGQLNASVPPVPRAPAPQPYVQSALETMFDHLSKDDRGQELVFHVIGDQRGSGLHLPTDRLKRGLLLKDQAEKLFSRRLSCLELPLPLAYAPTTALESQRLTTRQLPVPELALACISFFNICSSTKLI